LHKRIATQAPRYLAMAHHKIQQGLHAWASHHHGNVSRKVDSTHSQKFHEEAQKYHHVRSQAHKDAHDTLAGHPPPKKVEEKKSVKKKSSSKEKQWKPPAGGKERDNFDKQYNTDTAMQRMANYGGSQPGTTAAL
jgi:hypothetical protein